MYVAVSACLGSVAGGVGVLAAGGVLQALAGWHWSLFGQTVVGFHGLFLVSLVLRVVSTLGLVHRLHDPGAPQAAQADPSGRNA